MSECSIDQHFLLHSMCMCACTGLVCVCVFNLIYLKYNVRVFFMVMCAVCLCTVCCLLFAVFFVIFAG